VLTRKARVIALGLAACLLLHPRGAAAEDVRAAVEAGNRAFIAAFLRGDPDAVASLYTEQAQVIAPGSEVASGRAAIASFWRGVIESGVKDVALETQAVEAVGDLAYETGRVRLVAADGAVTVQRYVVVWKREGGRWKLHRDIWN
jgi:uncharacterized protein (TIGR02246 family)